MTAWLDSFIFSMAKKFNHQYSNYSKFVNDNTSNLVVIGLTAYILESLEEKISKVGLDQVTRELDNPSVSGQILRDIFLTCYDLIKNDKNAPLWEELKVQYNEYMQWHGEYETISLRPSASLVSDLINTQPPKLDSNIYGKRLFYIDLPKNLIVVNEVTCTAIFVDDKHVLVMGKSVNSTMLYMGYNHESASVISNFPITTIDATYKIMSNLTDLLILYFDSDQKKTQLLPSIKPKDLSKLSEKKQKAKLKSSSLFKLVYMERPNENKNWRSKAETKKTWDLTKLVSVKGHWRWQAYGERYSKHKLIWIDEYAKGEGEPDNKIEMTVLH